MVLPKTLIVVSTFKLVFKHLLQNLKIRIFVAHSCYVCGECTRVLPALDRKQEFKIDT